LEKLKKIERPTALQGLAYDKIKGLLVRGQFEFNEIYSANKLAQTLGVSRTPIREALLQLTAEGFLVSLQGRGFKIKEFTEKETKDFFETRQLIEGYVIELLGDMVGAEDLEALEKSLKQMKRAADKDDRVAFLEADKSFHMQLVHRYENRLLEAVMENIRNFVSIFGRRALSSEGRTEEVLLEHQRIIDAFRKKDVRTAVKAMKQHLSITEKYIIKSL